MSATTETEPGGEMVCIVAFYARPRDPDGRSVPGPDRYSFRPRRVTSRLGGTPEALQFRRYAIARRTAGGTGASFPLIDRQRISLSSKSSIRSYSSKSIFSERSAP